MNKTIILFLLPIIFLSCNSNQNTQIVITSETQVTVNDIDLIKGENFFYTYISKTKFPTILTLSNQKQEWEIYLEPNKNVHIEIEGNSISFDGDLTNENQYLRSEKVLNNEISAFLNNNWYHLHTKNALDFVKAIDSIKSIYIKKMDSDTNLNTSFRDVNTASIHYAFDRMILRYPKNYKNLTNKDVVIPSKHLQHSKLRLDNLKYSNLVPYKKYTKTWLNLEIEKSLKSNNDTTTYRGLVKTEIALNLISKTFSHQELIDYWSFEFIKSHIKKHTWINGKELLENLEEKCTTPSIKSSIKEYKRRLLEHRNDLETVVYKNEKGYQLEAYIFRPDNFDTSKKHPALAAFHGGGWTVGDASFTIPSAIHAAKNGLIGFSVEYRLSNRNDITPFEAMNDTRDFIRWLRNHADSLSINPDQIIAKGYSAGGHLVSSISVIQEDKESVPNALILVSPALETSDDYFKSLLKDNQKFSDFSSLGNLKEGLKIPQTLIFQGRTDSLTPTKYAEAFNVTMNNYGYDSELIIYENVGHLFTPSHLDDTAWPQPDPATSKKAFIKIGEFYNELFSK